jgi:hypothetical protein
VGVSTEKLVHKLPSLYLHTVEYGNDDEPEMCFLVGKFVETPLSDNFHAFTDLCYRLLSILKFQNFQPAKLHLQTG